MEGFKPVRSALGRGLKPAFPGKKFGFKREERIYERNSYLKS